MSYYPIDTSNQELINKQSVDISMTDRQKNMKYARHMQPHTDESKRKISETQQARYELLRMAVAKAANDDHIREVVKEEIDKFLKEVTTIDNKKPNIPVNL